MPGTCELCVVTVGPRQFRKTVGKAVRFVGAAQVGQENISAVAHVPEPLGNEQQLEIQVQQGDGAVVHRT